MKLRTQLLMITALVLILPLAGWQFVRTLEQSLREAHEQTLLDHAAAIARTLATEQAEAWPAATDGIYVHATDQVFHLDGHDGEWEAWLDQGRLLQSSDPALQARLLAASNRSGLHLLLKVEDPSVVFGDPERGPGDHVELTVIRGGREAALTLAPLAPGWIETRSVDGWLRVQGNWQPRSSGWTLEVRIAQPAQVEQMAIAVHAIDDPLDRQIVARAATTGAEPLIRPVPALQQLLAGLLPDNMRAWALTPAGWIVAREDRRLSGPVPNRNDGPDWLGTVMFERLLSGRLPVGETRDAYTARLSGEEVFAPPAATWVATGDGPGIAVTASAAVEINGQTRGVVVIERDADEFLVLANQAVLKLFGTSLAGMVLIALILLGFAAILSERIRRLRNAAERAVAPDGRVREPIAAPRARDEVGDLGRSMAELMTRQQTHQHYLQTLANKLAHELRTPLAMIRSSLDNLAQVEDETDRARYRQRAEEGCRRLGHILQGMSQAARVEESLHDEPFSRLNLAELVENYLSGCRTAYPNFRFNLDLPATGETFIHGSEDLIAQLLDKLIENASDFSPDNGRITARVKRQRDQVIVQIDNQGPPLPEGLADSLFDSMVSIRSSGEKDEVHMGLGLYVARLIVQHHGGSISALNLPGGCRFQINLPAA